jgi:hypothetical protein
MKTKIKTIVGWHITEGKVCDVAEKVESIGLKVLLRTVDRVYIASELCYDALAKLIWDKLELQIRI